MNRVKFNNTDVQIKSVSVFLCHRFASQDEVKNDALFACGAFFIGMTNVKKT